MNNDLKDENNNIYKADFSKTENKNRAKKEKITVIAASAFVLTALTMTGVYMSASEKQQQNNSIDFAKIQENQKKEADEKTIDSRFVSGKAEAEIKKAETDADSFADNRFVTKDMYDISKNNDMDVDPEYINKTKLDNEVKTDIAIEQSEAAEELLGTDKAAVLMDDETDSLVFSDTDNLRWPVVGKILIDYNMDQAVYHPTLQQYRYNPSIVIEATEGTVITAAADGIVKNVYNNAQTGNTIVFDIGGGYELTYGQLEDIVLDKGDRVKAGDEVGKVAAPTIYYSEEGSNVYFELTKDGVPVNPIDRLK